MLAVYAGKESFTEKIPLRKFSLLRTEKLMDWIRNLAVALDVEDVLCVHTACHWKWNKGTLKLAHEVENYLRSDRWQEKIWETFRQELNGVKSLKVQKITGDY